MVITAIGLSCMLYGVTETLFVAFSGTDTRGIYRHKATSHHQMALLDSN